MARLLDRTLEMRNAIDMLEGALMGCGNFIDLPGMFEGARDDLLVAPTPRLGQVRRVCAALSECTRIINSNDFSPDTLKGLRK